MHFVVAKNAELCQFSFLADLSGLPSQFTPTKLFELEQSGMYDETSTFVLGSPLGKGVSGKEPLGLHGHLLVNFSCLGLFFFFFLLGVDYKLIDNKLRPAGWGEALRWLIFLLAVLISLGFLKEDFIALILKTRFSWLLAISVLLWKMNKYELSLKTKALFTDFLVRRICY